MAETSDTDNRAVTARRILTNFGLLGLGTIDRIMYQRACLATSVAVSFGQGFSNAVRERVAEIE